MNATTTTSNQTQNDILHYAAIRQVRFSKHLVGASEIVLNEMVDQGLLSRVVKPYGRYAWQITAKGYEVHEKNERELYQLS